MDVEEQESASREAANVTLSDMDYLKRKITSEDNSNESGRKTEAKDKKKKKSKNENSEVDESEKKTISEKETTKLNYENQNESKDAPSNTEDFERKSDFTIKLRGLPFHAKKKDIEEFLSPLKILDIRMPKDNKNRPSGRAYIDLESKECMKDALKRHRDYIKGRYIEVFEDKRRVEVKQDEAENEPPWMENAKELAENKDLSIAEV